MQRAYPRAVATNMADGSRSRKKNQERQSKMLHPTWFLLGEMGLPRAAVDPKKRSRSQVPRPEQHRKRHLWKPTAIPEMTESGRKTLAELSELRQNSGPISHFSTLRNGVAGFPFSMSPFLFSRAGPQSTNTVKCGFSRAVRGAV